MRAFVTLLLLAALGYAGWVAIDRLPPQHSPFMPLDLEQPIGFATGMKIAALRNDPAQCRAALEHSALAFAPVANRSEGAFCGFRDAVTIERSVTRYSAPVRVSCPMAAALYVWEREVVKPAALIHLGAVVTRIDHAGTYACRRINNALAGSPSQHATANAIDVLGFRLSDGKRVSVLADWNGGNTARRAFLRDVRDGGCRLFRGVLGPDYNAAHRDHFHLDMGPYRVCR